VPAALCAASETRSPPPGRAVPRPAGHRAAPS